MLTPDARRVLAAVAALLVVLPLVRGGNHAGAVALADGVVLALLVATVRARRRDPEAPAAPGVAALVAFVGLALFTTVPLPPAVLGLLSPRTWEIAAAALPGWPEAGEWGRWRALALDPWGVWTELGRLAPALGIFTVLVAYPWRVLTPDDDARALVLARVVLAMLAGGALLGFLGLVDELAGGGTFVAGDVEIRHGRASATFVNPNHLALWLEMALPIGLAYALALGRRLGRRVERAAHAGSGMGVRARRAWVTALIAEQRTLAVPLAALAVVLVMVVAHLATGSRGGVAALLVGLAVTAGGAAAARGRRWVGMAAAVVLLAASGGAVLFWAASDDAGTEVDAVDVGLGSRLAVAAQGRDVLADFPLSGAGLGGWLHAYRRHQRPPVEGGIWDHAHNDYLELAAETGLAGVLAVALFGLAVAAAARSRRTADVPAPSRGARPPGFERAEWLAAFGERRLVRLGLAGALVALLVHATVDFGLRMPGNLVLAATVLALLVLSGPARPATPSRAVEALPVLLGLALVPLLASATLRTLGARPLAPADALAAADLVLAEGGEDAEAEARALVHGALDRSPASLEAHVAWADVLGPGPAGDAALERALGLAPWTGDVRDRLALRLWDAGDQARAEAELEDAMARFPYLVAHAYLSPDSTAGSRDARELLQVLANGDPTRVRVAALPDGMAGAVERGLRRALAQVAAGPDRGAVLEDLVLVLEARGRHADAAAVLGDEAAQSFDGRPYLARAARAWLRAGDVPRAEEALLAALQSTPERGELYRTLAVDVYAARGDFTTADVVLAAGERSAVDLLPVYRAVTEVLARRQHARDAAERATSVAAALALVPAAADAEETP